MVWSCFAASRPGCHAIIEERKNSNLCRKCMTSSLKEVGWSNNRGVQTTQVNYLKNKKKNCVLEWPNQCPDLSLTEMLLHDLKRTVQSRQLRNIHQSKQFHYEEWSRVPPLYCTNLKSSYRKRLAEVVAANWESRSYWIHRFTYFFQPALWMNTHRTQDLEIHCVLLV